ncbi:GNAT family N-acetyltransferase [Massilia arenosa]|uniref:GNAT family N-acetyltransferase n=1 Tax=Zemynaea arenosa TaxID=2561931 RepID=A0A4Y9S2C3_9BURK|nr:GNAT family N-acetyltransferase [Massilia arenosa]TFW15629.1 GNAT family N-acetyltransferase [Massilia arenosa]
MMTVTALASDEEIRASYPVMAQLRPDLDAAGYLAQVRSLQATEGLRLLAVRDQGRICAVASYRIIRMLYCDRILVIDDLVTDQAHRSQGVGSRLMDGLKHVARAQQCREVQLISRTTREDAHRFYFRQGFGIECFHLRWKVTPG